MSTITPPVATGAHTAAGLSGGDPNKIGFISMRLAVAGSIVPFIFIYTPDLLITSGVNVAATIFSFFVTGVGLLFLCAAVEGALLAPVRPYTRVLFAVIALLPIWPSVPVSLILAAAMALSLAACGKTDAPSGSQSGAVSGGKTLSMGTASLGGNFFTMGAAAASVIMDGTGLAVTAQATGGSVYNVGAVNDGELDLAMSQACAVASGYHGTDSYEGAPTENIDEITLMDPAGCMFPEEVSAAVEAMKKAVKVPIGFHCHANMGMCAANAMAAWRSGADILDCGLLGMARSAGNMPTELATALMQKQGQCSELDLYGLLHYLDRELIPAMEQNGYTTMLKPKDLILGYSGCHSAFVKTFTAVAKDTGVDLYRLIVETSALDRKDPDEALMRQVAASLK